MQKPSVVTGFLIPADQDTPEAVHPTMRPFHAPPPGFEARFLLERSGLFPPRTDVGSEAKLLQEGADLVIVIAFLQAQPLRCVGGRVESLPGKALNGGAGHCAIMAMRAVHRETDGHATASVRRRRWVPLLPWPVGFLPTFFPPAGGLGSRAVHRQPGPINATQGLIVHQALCP